MTQEQIEQREIALARSGWVCEVCGKPLNDPTSHPQASHRIGNTKMWRNKYGSFIIDHPLNVGYTCCLEHNAQLDISYNEGERLKLIADIVTYEINHFNHE